MIDYDLRNRIRQAQESDEFLKSLKNRLQTKQIEHFHIDEKGVMIYEERLCVPDNEELRNKVLFEAHYSKFTIHPGTTKIYQDLRKLFWRNGMKQDIASFAARCLTY